jgi:L-lactate dehydrogenase
VPELHDCAAVVVAARAKFTNTSYTNVRMGGLDANAPIIAEIAARLPGYLGVVVMVTNPVDLMARLFAETSRAAVVGIGSNLDSTRYRLTLARLFDVDPGHVAGRVIGEHGDAMVICASSTTIQGEHVAVPVEEIRAALLTRSAVISEGIGRTRAGPAGMCCPRCVSCSASPTGWRSCPCRTADVGSGLRCGSPAGTRAWSCRR